VIKRIAIFLLTAFLACGTALAADDELISTPCRAHLGSLGDTQPHAYEHYFEFDHIPAAASDLANAKLPNTVATIAVAPVTEADYQSVFGDRDSKVQSQAISTEQAREVSAIAATLKSNYGRDQGDRGFTEADYKSVLQAKAASFVIVIGHNEHGHLRLLDGKRLLLDDVVRGARADQRVILITCDSSSFVSGPGSAATINRKISYAEAFKIGQRISAFITAAAGPISIAQIQGELNRQVNSVVLTHKVVLFIMKAACAGGTAIVVALLIRELDPCTHSDRSDCPKSHDKQKKATESALAPTSAGWAAA
jgi:hypothetical protein